MKLSGIIDSVISGDWGNDSLSSTSTHPVHCIRSADIVQYYNNIFDEIPIRYITERSFNSRELCEGDIIIEKSGGTNECSTGRPMYVSKELLDVNPELICSNFCCAIRIKDGWDAKYIYYLIRLVHSKGIFHNYEGKTSGIHNLQMDAAFDAIELPDLSYEEQKKISAFLTSIEKKQYVNRKQNDILEKMAKQLYDYWFVQFDFPDENGKPYKSSGGAMVYNEQLKREIPEGWEVTTLSKILQDDTSRQINPQDTPDRIFKHLSFPSLDSCNSYKDEAGSEIRSNKIVVKGNYVLASKLNPWIKRIAWGTNDENLVCSTEFVVMIPNTEALKGYLFTLLNQTAFIDYCTISSTGTSHSQRRVNPDIMKQYSFPYCESISLRFSKIISEYIKQQQQNIKQNRELNSIKDFLLPLLMTGQVKLK